MDFGASNHGSLGGPVTTQINKESPIDAAEKRMGAAFDSLSQAMGRLHKTLSPVISPITSTLAGEGKESIQPCPPTQFERLVDRVVETVNSTTKEIHGICDRSVV
jgi:hypothetical protein